MCHAKAAPAVLAPTARRLRNVNIEPSLLEILACPDCRSPLRADEAASELVCTGCKLAYPVRDDIPVLLVDEARRR